MNKTALVEQLHQKFGGSKKTTEEIVDTLFQTIMDTLAKKEEVSISGFGTFFVKQRTAREGVNPRTGEKIRIGDTVTPKFKAGKAMKETVKNNSTQP